MKVVNKIVNKNYKVDRVRINKLSNNLKKLKLINQFYI